MCEWHPSFAENNNYSYYLLHKRTHFVGFQNLLSNAFPMSMFLESSVYHVHDKYLKPRLNLTIDALKLGSF